MKNILSDSASTGNTRGRSSVEAGRRGDREPSASLTQQVYERIRADLLACRLAPGEMLNIADLAKQLPASLGAVREALSRLTSEGLVEMEPKRGFRVSPLSTEDLHDLTALRLEIEMLCLRHAIEKGDLAWESALVGAYHTLSRVELRNPQDPVALNAEWIGAHHDFHEALVAACDSPWLLRVRRMLYAQSERYRQLSLPLGQTPRDLDDEHQQIMKAALDRNIPEAMAAITRHLTTTMTVLLEATERQSGQKQ